MVLLATVILLNSSSDSRRDSDSQDLEVSRELLKSRLKFRDPWNGIDGYEKLAVGLW